MNQPKSKKSMADKKQALSVEDSRIWTKVAKTVTPLSDEKGQFLKEEMSRLMEATSTSSSSPVPAAPNNLDYASQWSPPVQSKPAPHPIAHPIEERTIKNLGKGRQNIDARIDLHGMTQDRARFALLDFLQMAQRANHRIVLVITGKGDQGRGVLRSNVPRWLSLPAFSLLVNGYRESQGSHGGEGALYVRIRKANRQAKP